MFALFQNISCYCLTKRYAFNYSISLISKHLMLLFNVKEMQKKIDEYLFQNISCYCLTNTIFLHQLLQPLFQNISCYCLTSIRIIDLLRIPLFQNISCYCLTSTDPFDVFPVDVFQNISCYCLTACPLVVINVTTISKHLMLLFNLFPISQFLRVQLFQNISCYCLTRLCKSSTSDKTYFKTSHVIV